MAAETAGGRQRDIDLHSAGDRLLFKLMLMVVVPGVTWALAQPSPRGSWSIDAVFAVFAAAMCWLMFRAGFRIGVVAHAGHLTVTNFFSTHRVPYPDIEDIVLDWLTVRLGLTSGKRIRIWGLPESFLSARGGRGADLVERLGAIAERRAQVDAPAGYRRTVSADWWVLAALLAVFAAAIAYGQ